MANRNVRARVGFGPRRKMMWVRRFLTHTGSLGFVEDVFTSWRADQGTLANPPGLTVIREIVSIYYRAVAVDDTITQFLIGMLIAPISDLPPTDIMREEPGRDFMLWDHISFVQERAEGTPTQNLMKSKSWDLSGQRKIERTERTLVLMTESLNSDTIDYAWVVSALVKLP